jgi:hypothetical protein
VNWSATNSRATSNHSSQEDEATPESKTHDDDNLSSPESAPISATEYPPQVLSAPLKFVPTDEWLSAAKQTFPLLTCISLINFLKVQLQELGIDVEAQERVMAYIRGNTLVGVLPVPHPIVVRKYLPNGQTQSWFTSYLYSVIFAHNMKPKLFEENLVKNFSVGTSYTC